MYTKFPAKEEKNETLKSLKKIEIVSKLDFIHSKAKMTHTHTHTQFSMGYLDNFWMRPHVEFNFLRDFLFKFYFFLNINSKFPDL